MAVKLVKEIMISEVVAVSPFSTLRDALSVMKHHSVKSLVVERRDEHDAYGVLTYSHILKTIIAEEGDIDLINVYDVCAKPALSVNPNLAVRHAARLMNSQGVKRLLVTENNQLRGIITTNDLIRDILQMVD